MVVKQVRHACPITTQRYLMNKNKYGRWIVSWSNYYDDDDIETPSQAVLVALGDIEDTIRNEGLGSSIFIVEDTLSGDVVVMSAEVARLNVNHQTTVINVDQSVNISPTINIYNDGRKGTKYLKD